VSTTGTRKSKSRYYKALANACMWVAHTTPYTHAIDRMSLKPGRAAALLVHFSAFDFGNAEHSSEPKLVPEWMGDVPLYKCVDYWNWIIALWWQHKYYLRLFFVNCTHRPQRPEECTVSLCQSVGCVINIDSMLEDPVVW
jgi:hypothetical protein